MKFYTFEEWIALNRDLQDALDNCRCDACCCDGECETYTMLKRQYEARVKDDEHKYKLAMKAVA